MEASFRNIEELRSLWQFAAVCQFLHLFHEAIGLEYFDTDKLENCLVNKKELNPYLLNLHINLLQSLTSNKSIDMNNWEQYVSHEYQKRGLEENQYNEESPMDYLNMSMIDKVSLLHNLCEWQFDAPDRFRSNLIDEDEQVHWRVEPVGEDAEGNLYWLFDDNRLYKETVEKVIKPAYKKARNRKRVKVNKDAKTVVIDAKWELVCGNSNDWKTFPETFKESDDPQEKAFYEFLQEHLVDTVVKQLEESEKQRLLQEMLENRKRSNRLAAKQQAKETEKHKEQEEIDYRKIKQNEERRAKARQKDEDRRKRQEEDRAKRIAERERLIQEKEAKMREREERLLKRKLEFMGNESGMGTPGTPSEIGTPKYNTIPLQVAETPSKFTMSEQKKETVEESWKFTCLCGLKGKNIDDGTPMIACEKCDVWSHIRCQITKGGPGEPTPEELAQWEGKSFICTKCVEKQIKKEQKKMEKKLQKMEQKQQALALKNGTPVERSSGAHMASSPAPTLQKQQYLGQIVHDYSSQPQFQQQISRPMSHFASPQYVQSHNYQQQPVYQFQVQPTSPQMQQQRPAVAQYQHQNYQSTMSPGINSQTASPNVYYYAQTNQSTQRLSQQHPAPIQQYQQSIQSYQQHQSRPAYVVTQASPITYIQPMVSGTQQSFHQRPHVAVYYQQPVMNGAVRPSSPMQHSPTSQRPPVVSQQQDYANGHPNGNPTVTSSSIVNNSASPSVSHHVSLTAKNNVKSLSPTGINSQSVPINISTSTVALNPTAIPQTNVTNSVSQSPSPVQPPIYNVSPSVHSQPQSHHPAITEKSPRPTYFSIKSPSTELKQLQENPKISESLPSNLTTIDTKPNGRIPTTPSERISEDIPLKNEQVLPKTYSDTNNAAATQRDIPGQLVEPDSNETRVEVRKSQSDNNDLSQSNTSDTTSLSLTENK